MNLQIQVQQFYTHTRQTKLSQIEKGGAAQVDFTGFLKNGARRLYTKCDAK